MRNRLVSTFAGAIAAFFALAASDPAIDGAASIRAARDRVFPTLVHLQPVFDHSVGGRTIEAAVTGSGVVIAADGLVVTNYHVAGRAKRLTCTLADRRRCGADTIGADAATDLALVRLRLDELGVTSLPFATFGDVTRLEPGDAVIAMGSPLGLTRSLSCGVVSCMDRVLPDLTLDNGLATGDFNLWIQTDAAINPGNSGGPLVNLAGEIVGINTRGWRGAENLGFAIPADVVEEVVRALATDGSVRRATLGIRLQPLSDLERVTDTTASDGALVGSVAPDGPADRAGVRPGDVLVALAGKRIAGTFQEDLPNLRRSIAELPVGADVDVLVRRAGKEQHVVAIPIVEPQGSGEDVDSIAFGLTLRGLTDAERRSRDVPDGEGVLVTGIRPGSAAAAARPELKSGDVILTVGGIVVDRPEPLKAMLASVDGALLLTVARGHAVFRAALSCPAKTSPPMHASDAHDAPHATDASAAGGKR